MSGKFVPDVHDGVAEGEFDGRHLVAWQRDAAQLLRAKRGRVPAGGLGGVSDDDVRSDVHRRERRSGEP
jgi:hypothetical protein